MRSRAKSFCLVCLSISFCVLFPSLAFTQGPDKTQPNDVGQNPFEWTEGYSLFLTDAKTFEEANDLVDFIAVNGGQVALVISPRLMLGWLPADAEVALVGKSALQAVHRKPITPADLKTTDPDESDLIKFFNKVSSGEWRKSKAGVTDHGLQPNYGPDALEPPEGSSAWHVAADGTLSASPGNSDLMVGKAAFSAIFVESDGGIDANQYSWTSANITTIKSEIAAGLSFWSSKASGYGTPLTFTAKYYYPTGTGLSGGTDKVFTDYEPITHQGPNQDTFWISEIMCKFGQCAGDKFARTNAFNAAQRTALKTNWATTSFIAYNPSPAPTTFTDGWFAYAYRSGHYSQLCFRNDGWTTAQYDLVNAHETGHLFGAHDEYASSGCNNCFTSDAYAKDVVNGNCINCNAGSVPCMMRNNESALCGYTPHQIGWGLDIDWAKTINSGTTEKTNWVPGQTVTYKFRYQVPGRTGECVTLNTRWYRQFHNNLTEAEAWSQPCAVTSGGTYDTWLTRTIPAGAEFGDASWEVQVELVYSSGWKYGRGLHKNTRGKFFILTGAANMITTSPTFGPAPPPSSVRVDK